MPRKLAVFLKLWNSSAYCKFILNKMHVHPKFKRDYASIHYLASNQSCVRG